MAAEPAHNASDAHGLPGDGPAADGHGAIDAHGSTETHGPVTGHGAEAHGTTTEVGHHEKGGFPPFKIETFAGQFFWLAITFTFLFVVLWKVAGPRIQSTIAARRDKINGDLAAAEQARREAENASAAYDAALTGARSRALGLADENRKRIVDEIDRAKADADAEAAKATGEAEKRIAAQREQSKAQVTAAARDAAIEIVARLTGEKVSSDEAAAAIAATARS